MERWELILLIGGILLFIYVLLQLNQFVNGSPITSFIGTATSFGIFIILIGIFAWAYISGEITKELGKGN